MGKRIKIGIDGSKLSAPQKTGVEYTVFQIVKNLALLDKKNDFIIFTQGEVKGIDFPNNFKVVKIGPKKFWHRLALPLALIKYKPDVFLELSSALPTFAPKNSFVMIHDFAFNYFPQSYSRKDQFLQNDAVKRAIRKAKKIILTSQANRDDFIRFYHNEKVPVEIVPLAYDNQRFKQIDKPKDVLNIREYILFIGRIESRKNVLNIVKAFEVFKNKSKSDIKLVLAGKPGHNFEIIETAILKSKYNKDIIQPGYIHSDELPHVLSRAKLFLFPSEYEGYGIPILEAFASGVPVITSNIPVITEVVGDSKNALLADPQNIEEIADKIDNLIGDQSLRECLIANGLERTKDFSWQTTAEKILKLIS